MHESLRDFISSYHNILPYTPENKSEITNNDQRCANTIKNTLNPGFYHIKYEEQYMPVLFLTLPELQHKRRYQLFMVLLCFRFDDFAKTPQNPKS